jgi:beta-phosphoglucomutase-like phosphatase (HAD superfamily)
MDYKIDNIFLLLDLDGTILDTDRLQYESYKEVLLTKYNYLLTYAEFDEITNTTGMKTFIINNFGKNEYENIKNNKDLHFINLPRKDNTTLIQYMKNAEVLIDYIITNNVNYAIVTNSYKSMVNYYKEKIPKLKLLHNWVTRDDYNLPKPDKEPYVIGLTKYKKNEKYVIGIENTILGYYSLVQVTNNIYIMSEKTSYNYNFFKEKDVCIISNYMDVLHKIWY